MDKDYRDLEYCKNTFNETRKLFLSLRDDETYQRRITTQLDYCERVILEGYAQGKKVAIVRAPTGSGKSMHALIYADFFSRNNKSLTDVDSDGYMPRKSYVLTSNKFLQDQQIDTAKKFGIGSDIALLKGQSNYYCHINKHPFTQRECIDMSIKEASELKCAEHCEYIRRREQCQNVSTMVTSYHYWLTAMNMSFAQRGSMAAFTPRELSVFDEGHTLEDIVQDMFCFRIDDTFIPRVVNSYNDLISIYVNDTDFDYDNEDVAIPSHIKSETMMKHFELLMQLNEDIQVLFNTKSPNRKIYLSMGRILDNLSTIYKDINKTIISAFPNKKNQSIGQTRVVSYMKGISSVISELYLSHKIFESEGFKTIVQDISQEEITTNSNVKNKQKQYKNVATFKCKAIGALMYERVFKYTEFSIITSATFGGSLKVFGNNLGIKDEDMYTLDIPSDFNFNDSPIVILNPDVNLSYNTFDKHIDVAFRGVLRIVNEHPNDNIIVHGTKKICYLLSKSDRLHQDMKFYRNEEEKAALIDDMKYNLNSCRYILVGHSLVEGVSFDDHMARVNILIKTPYESLADNYNKVMADEIPSWYLNKTLMKTEQMIGRTIRHKNDHAITYIIDSNFNRIFSDATNFPKYIMDRVQVRQWDYLTYTREEVSEFRRSGVYPKKTDQESTYCRFTGTNENVPNKPYIDTIDRINAEEIRRSSPDAYKYYGDVDTYPQKDVSVSVDVSVGSLTDDLFSTNEPTTKVVQELNKDLSDALGDIFGGSDSSNTQPKQENKDTSNISSIIDDLFS